MLFKILTGFLLVVVSELSCVKGSESNEISNYLCTETKCIMKCCPLGKHLSIIRFFEVVDGKNQSRRRSVCSLSNTTRDILSLQNENIFYERPSVSDLKMKSGIFERNTTFKSEAMDVSNLLNVFNMYLTKAPELLLEQPNAYIRFTKIPNNRFCWEYKIRKANAKRSQTILPGIFVVFEGPANEPRRTSEDLLTYAMLVSCFFLMLVLIVYGLLPELRNLCGLILMAYVATLFIAFLMLACMRITQHEKPVCLRLTYPIYYFFLASFCWMNVMSYDIWWTFRGYAKARPIHRRGEMFKFLMYCLYAFGVPLAMTIMLGCLNHVPMAHYPWIVTPKITTTGCFIDGGEKFLYLYVPMLILIVCNWMFYLMTAFNIWRLSRGTAVLDSAAAGTPQAHRTHWNRYMVYLKLSVVMGLNWVLEVVSFKYPGAPVWYISDAYNILIGVSIFLIFVCKRKILRKLTKLYLRFKGDHWRPGKDNSMRSTSSDSSSSNASNETQTLQVCVNPKGPGYAMKPV